jgi:hypothetical protein
MFLLLAALIIAFVLSLLMALAPFLYALLEAAARLEPKTGNGFWFRRLKSISI